MANQTSQEIVKQAGSTGLPVDPVVIAAVGIMTVGISAGIYMYFSDKNYKYLSRAAAFISDKLGAQEEDKGVDMEQLEEETEKVTEETKDVNADPEQLFNRMEAALENMEYIGRQEERKKQQKQDDIRDIVIVAALASSAELVITLYQMFIAG